MIVKAHVLDRQNRVFDHGRNLFELQRNALFERELTNEGLLVIRVNARDDAGPVSGKRGNFAGGLRIIELISRYDAAQSTGRQRQQNYCRKPEPAQNMFALTRRGGDDCLRCIRFQTGNRGFC